MTYVFKCEKCDKGFEIIGGFSVLLTSDKKCPNCGSIRTKRVYTPTEFILKGGGFYKTDKDKK